MNTEYGEYKKELQTALESVRLASKATSKIQKSLRNRDIEKKTDSSPVTIADYAAQAIVNKHLFQYLGSDQKMVAEEDSSDQERQGAIYSLSQLRYIAEDYKAAIGYLLEWLDNEEEPSSDGYGLLAQAYYQVEDYQKSVEAIDTAIEIQESRDIAIKIPVLDAEGNETGEMIETGETRK